MSMIGAAAEGAGQRAGVEVVSQGPRWRRPCGGWAGGDRTDGVRTLQNADQGWQRQRVGVGRAGLAHGEAGPQRDNNAPACSRMRLHVPGATRA
jgi:hypothetical protein